MRILLIDNDAGLDIEKRLAGDGIGLHFAAGAEEGLGMVRHFDYDLILLGAKIGDMTTLEALRLLRKAGVEKPVLMVAADASVAGRVAALNSGADDVIVRPFAGEELVARVRSLVRRSRGLARSTIQIGGVTVDLAARQVEVGGQKVDLTTKEYQVMELLSLRRGVTQSRETIIHHLYLDGEGPESNTIGLFVFKLRKKLGDDLPLATVWGIGYRLG